MYSDFKEELSYCPDFWRYVPLDGNKAPNEEGYDPIKDKMVKGFGWPSKLYNRDEICTKPKEAIGLHLGPASYTAAIDVETTS